MKWIIVLVLAIVVFGGAAFFSYDLFVKPERTMRAEQSGEIPEEPKTDVSLADFQAAAKLRQEGNLIEARSALNNFLTRYPSGLHTEEAKDLLGDINTEILLSRVPSPEKKEYVVRSGDVLARVAQKMKTTPELIMRTNGLTGTMLHIGDRLYISHPELSLYIQRKASIVVVINHGTFFKRYRVRQMKVAPKQPPKITTHVAETMAWKNGKRVGFGTKEYAHSTRWIRLAQPGYVLYPEPDPAHPNADVAPPPLGLGMAAPDVEELSGLVNAKTAVTITD